MSRGQDRNDIHRRPFCYDIWKVINIFIIWISPRFQNIPRKVKLFAFGLSWIWEVWQTIYFWPIKLAPLPHCSVLYKFKHTEHLYTKWLWYDFSFSLRLKRMGWRARSTSRSSTWTRWPPASGPVSTRPWSRPPPPSPRTGSSQATTSTRSITATLCFYGDSCLLLVSHYHSGGRYGLYGG